MPNLNGYLKKLLTKPPTLSAEDLNEALSHMINGEICDVQISAFLTALRVTELDHSSSFVSAAAARIFEESHRMDYSSLNPDGYVDIVGTGGDGQNTFNVSTTAGIIAAGIPGVKVCKHGGKASTATSGAGDLLKSLGVDLFNVTHSNAPEILQKSQFTFLFAPVFHPMMASLAPLRREMGMPTIFNIMGPLLNPAPIKGRIIGVYDESLGQVFAEAVRDLNHCRLGPAGIGPRAVPALIVWGEEGLDEISPAGNTRVWHLHSDETIEEYTLHPTEDFGLPTHELSEVKSGSPSENAEMVWKIVRNELPENHPVLDYVLLNTAALAYIDGTARDWKHGIELARESIRSGSAEESLKSFISVTNSA